MEVEADQIETTDHRKLVHLIRYLTQDKVQLLYDILLGIYPAAHHGTSTHLV